jgi:carboxymethylenebutenolidase
MKKWFLFVIAAALAFTSTAQDWAKTRLDKSPRHLDWVKVKNGKRDINCFIAYPEVKDKATAVLVIHEIYGLSDWVRGVCDQLAEAGYTAIAPDLLSGTGPKGGGTSEYSGNDTITKAVRSLPDNQVTSDLNQVADYVTKLAACNGKLVVSGFCWGGGQSFRFATNNKKLKAAFVFYGPGPENEADVKRIACPVYGFYAENDARINASLPTITELMQKAGKTYEKEIYSGAGHGFIRAGEAPDASDANKKARDDAWKRWKDLLKKI